MESFNTLGNFPTFEDGDVSIVVSTSRIYRLHSHVIRRLSSHFSRALDRITAPRLTAAARRQGSTPYRFVLIVNEPSDDGPGHFVPSDINENGRILTQEQVRASNRDLGLDDEEKAWDWVFGCFYNITPTLDNSTFAATVKDCFVLLEFAEAIGAVDHVREIVDLALMRQDEVLWKSIARAPAIWAELGRRVQSPAIFKEAVIHLVGQWKMLEKDVEESLPRDIHALCLRKWKQLELRKRAIEIRIKGHYPKSLCREHDDKPTCSDYAKDIYPWMVLCFFRQWATQSADDGENRSAEDGGYQWYKQISEGGEAYLNHEHMANFHQFFPMSRKACKVVEGHMKALKEQLKEFVQDLMIVRTHIDPAIMEGVKPWLTCTTIDLDDLPWIVAE